MNAAEHLQMVNDFYTAFGRNDMAMMVRNLAEDFRMEIPQMDHLPLKPEYLGAAGLLQMLKDREPEIRYSRFDIDDRVAQGNLVAVVGRTEGVAIKSGKRFSHQWVHVFRFAEGRIAHFKEYIDSSSVCSAFCA